EVLFLCNISSLRDSLVKCLHYNMYVCMYVHCFLFKSLFNKQHYIAISPGDKKVLASCIRWRIVLTCMRSSSIGFTAAEYATAPLPDTTCKQRSKESFIQPRYS